MSKPGNNPLVRFAAFWWGLAVFSLFGVLALVAWFFQGGEQETDPLEAKAAEVRYGNRAKTDAAQAANFAYKVIEEGKTVQVPPHDVYPLVGSQLLAAKPAAVEKPEQIVPGGLAEKARAGEQGADLDAVNKLTPDVSAPLDQAQMELGKQQYILCSACHGQNGEGGAGGVLAPPLADSEWVRGPVSNLILIQLRGLTGPIHVQGKIWPVAAPMMAPQHFQDDAQIAAVLTYVRNSFGNKGSAVLPEQVKMLRGEVGKPMLTEADLIKP